ncbi:MAG: hypothetical protein IKR11_00095 [Solobacterium sp.]|nr:hypothetical protein [Solobacterium sp.]
MSDYKKMNCKAKHKIVSYMSKAYQNSRQRMTEYDSRDNRNHILYEGNRKLVGFADPDSEKYLRSAHEVIQSGFLQKHHR